ncbi:DNA adenine methylase [Lignipirellula cremea]|nr:DNA adenine methylase [Lignipirellula cremea]
MLSRSARTPSGTPITEGIKYAGSKRKLVPQILALADQVGAKSVLDGFAGSTRVSQAFARAGYHVTANDVNVWSQVFATCYLRCERPASAFADLLEHLNGLPPVDGWFTENYGGDPGAGVGPKRPWQLHNTRRIDAIREEIDRLALSGTERAVALTSLILAMDKVDSTLGHYVSYLRHWSRRSYGRLELQVPALVSQNEEQAARHTIRQADVFDVAGAAVDLAYYDPPYGSSNEKMPPSRVRYAAYYHVWTTVCQNDKPDLFGKAQRRADSSDGIAASVFEEFRRNPQTGRFLAVEAIERLLQSTAAPWVLLSYSSGGRATAEELHAAIARSGRIVELVERDHQRNVMAGMKWTNDWIREIDQPHREFLFLIERSAAASDETGR